MHIIVPNNFTFALNLLNFSSLKTFKQLCTAYDLSAPNERTLFLYENSFDIITHRICHICCEIVS